MEVLIESATTVTPDRQLFAQALAVLERERPTRRAELLFHLLNGLWLGALLLTVLYIIQLQTFEVSQDKARPIAWAAASFYVLIVPFSLLNLGFLSQIRRAASLQRQLNPNWKLGLQARFSDRRGQRTIANLATSVLYLGVGLVFVLAGGLGLYVQLFIGPAVPVQLALVMVLTFFGVTAVLLPYVAKGRERLQVIAALRTSLLAEQTDAYDEMARFDRNRVRADRERSIKMFNRSGAKATVGESSYSYQESRAVRDAKQALASTELMGVLAHIDRLSAEPPHGNETDSHGQISYDRIEGTHLELAYSIDHEARDVRLISLAPLGTCRSGTNDDGQAHGSEFKVKRLESAQALDRKLSAEERKAADDIIGELAADPAKYRHLATNEEGQLLRRNASRSFEVAYNVDATRETVNVVHVSPRLPAFRTLFISYSHTDQQAFADLMKYLRPLETQGLVDIWSDDLIKPSEEWEKSIRSALDRSEAALLLVSQEFLVSEFVNEVELPYLLRRAEQNQTFRIFWVPVRTSTVFDSHKDVAARQSLLKSPTTTSLQKLGELGTAQRDDALLEIYNGLREALVGTGGGMPAHL